jgi:hypothetical protein
MAITTYKSGKAGLTAGIIGNGALDAHGPGRHHGTTPLMSPGRQGGALQEPRHL